jgi:hypothetical protein
MITILRWVGYGYLIFGLAIIGLGMGMALYSRGLAGVGDFFSIDNTRNWIVMLMTLAPAILFIIIARRLDQGRADADDQTKR